MPTCGESASDWPNAANDSSIAQPCRAPQQPQCGARRCDPPARRCGRRPTRCRSAARWPARRPGAPASRPPPPPRRRGRPAARRAAARHGRAGAAHRARRARARASRDGRRRGPPPAARGWPARRPGRRRAGPPRHPMSYEPSAGSARPARIRSTSHRSSSARPARTGRRARRRLALRRRVEIAAAAPRRRRPAHRRRPPAPADGPGPAARQPPRVPVAASHRRAADGRRGTWPWAHSSISASACLHGLRGWGTSTWCARGCGRRRRRRAHGRHRRTAPTRRVRRRRDPTTRMVRRSPGRHRSARGERDHLLVGRIARPGCRDVAASSGISTGPPYRGRLTRFRGARYPRTHAVGERLVRHQAARHDDRRLRARPDRQHAAGAAEADQRGREHPLRAGDEDGDDQPRRLVQGSPGAGDDRSPPSATACCSPAARSSSRPAATPASAWPSSPPSAATGACS